MRAREAIPSPVRVLGAARVVAGGWLVARGAVTLSHFSELQPMAQRLFIGDPGTTDAPIRSLLTLASAPLLVAIGIVLMVKGVRWMQRIPRPTPAEIARDEVIATLVRREAPAFGAGPSLPYWPLRRWLSDKLSDLTWWRRDLMSRGVRALGRACGFIAALAVLYVALRSFSTADLLGPFPTVFVFLLLVATAAWAVLGLMLIPSDVPRIESFEFPLPERNPKIAPDTIVESAPQLLARESPTLGLTLGIVGVAVQCLIAVAWELSSIGYPLMATSIVRHIGSLAGGVVFLVLGGRMVTAAAEMLRSFRYESTIVYIEGEGGRPQVGHGATVRTESRGGGGPRHIVVAVAGSNAREAAASLLIPKAS